MGRRPCCSKEGLNRGAWTALEDKTLSEYIKLHGEGKWRSLPQKAGLKRCGKSCRLRWLNYLRPDIKRGNISVEEEDLIIRLHKLLGNRWSLIAGRLPGRTDNEIKNYWNTNLTKKVKHKIDEDDVKNKKTHVSHNVIRTKALKLTKSLLAPQSRQTEPVEANPVAKIPEAHEKFISKTTKLSSEEETKPMDLMFNATVEEDTFLSDVLNLDFSGFLDFNNGNNDIADELSPSSDGSLIFPKDLNEKSSFFYFDTVSTSYEDFAKFI